MALDFAFQGISGGGGGFSDPPLPAGAASGTLTMIKHTAETISGAPIVGPAQVHLEFGGVTNLASAQRGGAVYDFRLHEYHFYHYIEGAPLNAMTAPSNLKTGWNNPNIGYGPNPSFCLPYRSAPYVIWSIVVDRFGAWALTSTTVQVLNPDAVFPGAQTICYSPGGDFANKPTGAAEETSLSTLQSTLNSASQRMRVVLPRGEAISDFDISFSSGARLDALGAYGNALFMPVVRPPKFSAGSSNMLSWRRDGPEDQITIDGIWFQGHWEPDTETGSLGGGSLLEWRTRETRIPITVANCKISNSDWELSANFAPLDICVFNTVSTAWQQYGAYCGNNDDGRYAFIGFEVSQSVLALQGGVRGSNIHNAHGAVRLTACAHLYMIACGLFNTTGWSSFHAQPCLRHLTRQVTPIGAFFFIVHCLMEGGYQVVNFEGENTGAADSPVNGIFDGNAFVGSALSNQAMVSIHRGGTTIRNNHFVLPNSPNFPLFPSVSGFIDLNAANHTNGNAAEPITIYNNFGLDLRDDANSDGPVAFVWRNTFSNVVQANNARHEPNRTGGYTADGPFDMSPTVEGFTPQFPGCRFGWQILQITSGLSSPVPPGGSFLRPYSDFPVQDRPGSLASIPTDQAYFDAVFVTDQLHQLSIEGAGEFYAEDGDFTATPEAGGIRFTNTGGSTWPAGARTWINLDRTSRLASQNPLQTQYATTGPIPLPEPEPGSPLRNPGGAGPFAIADIDMNLRPIGRQDAGPVQVTP